MQVLQISTKLKQHIYLNTNAKNVYHKTCFQYGNLPLSVQYNNVMLTLLLKNSQWH